MDKLLRTTTALLAVALMALFSACGGGGSIGLPPGGSNPAPSGTVTLAIKDAPLSELANFTIDISAAALKGAGVPDAQIFPAPNAAVGAFVTVDLLSAQAFSVLLGSSPVPVGNYYAVELTYSNPQAVTHTNVTQNIQHVGNTLTGVFTPPLAVAANSSQTVQVDVDLNSSVIDLGPTDLFLAPVVLVQVLNQPAPVQRFPAQVTAIDSQNDRFTADIRFYNALGASGGTVTVQCSPTTGFKDGNGTIVTGNVTTQLVVGDMVLINGTLTSGTLDADLVVRVPAQQPGIGLPGGQPPAVDVGGTITAVDTVNSTMSIRVQRSFGPSTRPANGTTITVSVLNSTSLTRGPFAQQLSDFELGNYANAFIDNNNSVWEAIDITEGPAQLTGTAVSLQTGAGANSDDLLTFTPTLLENLPVSNFPFVPAQMTADIPPGSGITPNATVTLVGFFDGTAHFDAFGRMAFPGGGNVAPGIPGFNRPPANPGSGNPGGGGGQVGGPNLPPGGGNGGPVVLPPPIISVTGTLAASTTAVMNSNGDLEFTLDLLALAGPGQQVGPATMDVIALSNITVHQLTNSGQRATITLAQAQAEINSNPNLIIQAEGSQPPTSGTYTADIGLVLLPIPANAPSLPGGGSGGGNLPGNPGGGGSNPGIPGPVMHTEFGPVTANTTATVSNTGEVTFSLDALRFGINFPAPTPITVTVSATATMQMLTQSGMVTLTAAQAATELDAAAGSQTVMVEVVGTNAASGTTFTADVSMTILQQPSNVPPPGGNLPPNPGPGPGPGPVPPQVTRLAGTIAGTASLNGNGEVVFTLVDHFHGNVTVTVAASATIYLVNTAGPSTGPGNNLPPNGGGMIGIPPMPQVITAAQAVTELNGTVLNVAVVGTGTVTAGAFTADIEMAIIK